MQDSTCLVHRRYQTTSSPDAVESLPPALEIMLDHRSTRNFLKDSLPPNTLETLFAAGQSASSSSMLQPWSAIAVMDPDLKEKAATLAGDQDFIREAPLFLVFCADLSRLTHIAKREKLADPALEKTDMFVMATIDASLASQNISLAAEALGLGVCYVGGSRNNAKDLCELLRLPPRTMIIVGMAIGYPDPSFPTSIKPRLEQREVFHRDYWNDCGQDQRIDNFNQTLDQFHTATGKPGRETWSRHCAEFVAREKLDGRERYRNALDEQGFALK